MGSDRRSVPPPGTADPQIGDAPPREELLTDVDLRALAGQGWGAVLVWSLVLAGLAIALAAGPRDNPQAGLWPGAVGFLTLTGAGVFISALAARPMNASSREVLLGRVIWGCVGLALFGFGLDEWAPQLGASWLALPCVPLAGGLFVWLAFGGDRPWGHFERALGFAAGRPRLR